MSVKLHLILRELVIGPSVEWFPGSQGSQGWIIIRVADGAGYWLKGQQAGELNGGDGLVLGFDDKTQLRASSLCPMKLQFFTVQPHFLGLLTVAEWHQFKTVSENSSSYFLLFRANELTGRKFARLSELSQGSGLSARCALLQFWADIVADVLAPSEDSGTQGNKLRDRFHQLFRQMSEIELTVCSLPELAQQLNCSPRHFCRLFREKFGVPLQVLQTELRLSRVRQLLAESDATVLNVANQCGYQHLSFFNSMFKKRFGMTPGEWRRQAQKNLLRPPSRRRSSPTGLSPA
jgi:AraC-like DNA-binding protein